MTWYHVLAYVGGLLTPIPLVLYGRATIDWADRRCLDALWL